jgi:hypothetical protein
MLGEQISGDHPLQILLHEPRGRGYPAVAAGLSRQKPVEHDPTNSDRNPVLVMPAQAGIQ